MQTVLLIDDEEFQRVYLGKTLKRMGFDVAVAGTGKEGIEKCQQIKPDGVILDIVLGDMNGDEVFRRIKEVDDKIRVYFISGSEHEISNMKCQHYPANGFLVKPVILDELTMIMDDIRKNGKNSPIK